MDETRAILDALMGPNRNQKPTPAAARGGGERPPEFHERTVCKNFLVGFCPHDWFSLARRQLAPCTKIHSEVLRESFERHSESARYRAEYEEDFLCYLEKVAQECDQYILRERAKCRPKSVPGQGKTVNMPREVKEKCEDLERRYAELVARSEELQDTSLSKSKETMSAALAMKEDLDALKAKYVVEFAGEDICEVCGVKYPLGGGGADWHDKESHMKGKTHTGYAQIREKITELRGKRRSWEKYRKRIEEDRSKERVREKEFEKEKEKERQRKREQEREEERRKQREAEELERERERERQRERERERERERDRSSSRERRRDQAPRRFRGVEGDGRERDVRGKEKEKEKPREPRRSGASLPEVKRQRQSGSVKRSIRGEKSASAEKQQQQHRRGSVESDDESGRSSAGGGGGSPEAARSEASGGSGGGLSVDEEEIPELWGRLSKFKPEEREDAVKALSPTTRERLEQWLVERMSSKRKKVL